MSNRIKVDILKAVTKENDVLMLGKEDQKEKHIAEKEIYCRYEEENYLSLEVGGKGGKIVEADIESPVVSKNLQGLKASTVSNSMEGGADEVLMEGRFCVEKYTTGNNIIDFTEFQVMLQENVFKLFQELVDKYEDDFIIKLVGSSSKGGKGRSPMTAGGARPSQGTISEPSLSKGRRSGSFLTSPVKKGKFFSSGVGGSQSNLYLICVKNEDFLIVFAEDGLRQINYTFPGSQRKAWCTAFERDLKTENVFSGQEVSPICGIVKRRDVRENGDVYLPQRTNGTFHMSAYLCPFDEDDTAAGVSNQIHAKLNQYAATPRNNVKMFRYIKDTTEGLKNDDIYALDCWLVTRKVVLAVASLYEDVIQDEIFYE